MAELIGVLKKSLWFTNQQSLVIDSWAFKISNKLTAVIFIMASVVVSTKQLFGKPIKCDVGYASDSVREDLLDSYCWMYAHFNIPKDYRGPCTTADASSTPIYNTHYQWIPLYLNFLAILFFLPRILWMKIEGGVMKYLTKGTTGEQVECRGEKRDDLISYFLDHIHNRYKIYYLSFVFCECLYLGLVCASFAMTDHFLNHRFLDYGISVWNYYRMAEEMNDEQQTMLVNPMCHAFPRIAACNYYRFGPAGKQMSINALCILSLNVINDKVFMVIWWWMFLLAFVAMFVMIVHLAEMVFPVVRYELLRVSYRRRLANHPEVAKLRAFVCESNIGDWFVLYQMSKNINRRFFMDFLDHLSKAVKNEPEEEERNFLEILTEKEKLRQQQQLQRNSKNLSLAQTV